MSRIDTLKNFISGVMRGDSIANYLSGLGDPSKDSGASGKPSLWTRLEPTDLDALYLQNDIAGIIVDEIVDEALRNGFTVDVADDPEDALDDELKTLHAASVIGRAGKWGRLYGAGFVLMVIDDGLDPIAPVEVDKIQGVTQLIDLDRWEVEPVRWQLDINRPHFGEPEVYRVAPHTSGGAVEGMDGQEVHTTRLLKFGGVELPRAMQAQNGGYDDSVLQRPWDAIRRFCETENGMARIVQSFERATISVSGLASVLSDPEGEALIGKRMQLLNQSISMLNAVLLDADAGEQYERSSSTVTGLPELWDRFKESVARSARMPQTILFGTAPSGLNTDGESGIQGWHKRVHAYQEQELAPEISRLVGYLFAADGEEPEEWVIAWAPLDEPGEKEQAEIRKIVAETDEIYLTHGVRSPDQVAESRDGSSGWSMETAAPDEDIGYQEMVDRMEADAN